MKQTRIEDISAKTQTGSAPANGAAARLVRQGQALGGGLLRKAGILALLLGLPLGASLATAGEEPQYRFIEIPLPVPSYAVGINDEGLVTGFYQDPTTGDVFSFQSHHGDLITGISAPGATFTAIGPANNFGFEAGNVGSETTSLAVLYDIRRGSYFYLPEIPGMPYSLGDGVNDFGHASGIAYPSGGFFTGGVGLGTNWIWDGERYSFFDVPGAVNGTVAGGINDWDQVAGFFIDASGNPQGFVKDGSHYTTFNAPGALLTVAFGINNQGVVAGLYVNPDGSQHGYFWCEGKFTTVDVPLPAATNGTLWYQANDRGDLAGVYYDSTSAEHAIIAIRLDGDCDGHDRH
jgi:hypothetical protein